MDAKYLERLTQAVYRVTDRMEDVEPLKWKIRSCALSLSELYFENTSSLSLREEDTRNKDLESLLASIARLLELAGSFSYISRINFDVLLREYIDLQANLFPAQSQNFLDAGPSAESEGGKSKEFVFTARQQRILEFLAKTENIGISELAAFFQNEIGEKTIQRELNELISCGAVKTSGEKRWRKYSRA